ncbi:MAG: FRG domain-containing protein [Planctomycetota bacterium]
MAVLHDQSIMPLRPNEGRHLRSPYVFRGMDNADWGLESSFARIHGRRKIIHKKLENSMIRSFRKFADAGTFDQKSEWYVQAVAQHNGMPTRCLDWSASQLVAIHFACGDEQQKSQDGAIWCLHSGRLRDANRISNTSATSLQGSWVYDTRILEHHFGGLDDFDNTNADGEMLILWEPPSLDSRIANQMGLLSVMNDPIASQEAFLAHHCPTFPDLLVRIIIDASMKSEARDKLDQNNISERTMFPGLPGLCSWLKRYYGEAW